MEKIEQKQFAEILGKTKVKTVAYARGKNHRDGNYFEITFNRSCGRGEKRVLTIDYLMDTDQVKYYKD